MKNTKHINIKDKHGTLDVSDAVAVINRKQWVTLCKLAQFNAIKYNDNSIRDFMLDLLGNDDIFKGNKG